MAYNSKAIANYFLDIAEKTGDTSITPMKIQKLVYYAQGWHLAIFGRPLIHEQIEAWQYGPVIESLFHEFKSYGRDCIKSKATSCKFPDGVLVEYTPSLSEDDNSVEDPSETSQFLDEVWNAYGKFTGIQLSNMTHAKGGPWDTVAQTYGGDPPRGTDIPTDLIQRYFREMSEKKEATV
jgi:uncharacterized phage-associated protein